MLLDLQISLTISYMTYLKAQNNLPFVCILIVNLNTIDPKGLMTHVYFCEAEDAEVEHLLPAVLVLWFLERAR